MPAEICEANFVLNLTSLAESRGIMKTKVKELRNKAKLTQQQLADLVYVSSRTIISIEKE